VHLRGDDVWNKIKIIGLVIGLIAVTVAGFIFGRRSSNGSGVSGDNGLSDNIGSGIDRSEEGNRAVQDELTQGTDSINRAGDRISSAQDKLRSSIEILRNAKAKG